MTQETPVIAELQPLLDALVEEAITPEQLQRLEELVLAHPEAETHYIQFMSFQANVIGHVAGLPEPKAVSAEVLPSGGAEHSPPEGGTPTKTQALAEPMKPQEKRKRSRRAEKFVAWSIIGLVGLFACSQLFTLYARSRDVSEMQTLVNASQNEFNRLKAEDDAARKATRQEVDSAHSATAELAKQYVAAQQNARKAIEEKDFIVRLTGPSHIQPGAPNKWQIETLRHGAIGRPKKLEVVVKDAKDKELLRQIHEKPPGAATLELGPAFWSKVEPGAELFLEVVSYNDTDSKSVLAERLPLARPVFITHLVTDKPLYKPGEIVRFRSLTLDRSTLQPPQHEQHLIFRLRDPANTVIPIDEGNGRLLSHDLKPVVGSDNKPLRGIGVGEFGIPAESPGGEYKLDLYEFNHETNKESLVETRKFIVNRYVPDIFEKKLEFDGKSYGPNEFVQARIDVSRTAGGPMKDAKADVVASADGKNFHEQKGVKFTTITDASGTKTVLDVRFKLPAEVFDKNSPNATLSVSIQDGSDVETIVRPIPLVTKTLRVEFFPEGGDMIVGVPGRVYFMVRTPNGKPADLKGVITDGTRTVAEVATLTDAENPGANRGHGVFTLTPERGKNYFLKLTSPTGITEPTPNGFQLPGAHFDGIAITALDTVTPKGGAIRVKLQSPTGPKTLHVGAYVRERLIAQQKIALEANKPTEVTLQSNETAGGVTRITAFELVTDDAGRGALLPRAERLIFRATSEQLVLSAKPDKQRYSPSDRVKLDLTASTEKRTPTPAVLLVGVVNRSVITMADNKNDRLQPTHFLLSGEVKYSADLEHADFLLTDHPKAGIALDLLLGTQGWRRFAEQELAPRESDKQDVESLLIAHGQRTTAPLELIKLEVQRLNAEYAPKLELARLRIAAAEAAWKATPTAVTPQLSAASNAMTEAQSLQEEAKSVLRRFTGRYEKIIAILLPIAAITLLIAGGVYFTSGTATKPAGRGRPYVVAGLILAVGFLGWLAFSASKMSAPMETPMAMASKDEMSMAGPRFTPPAAPTPQAMPMLRLSEEIKSRTDSMWMIDGLSSTMGLGELPTSGPDPKARERGDIEELLSSIKGKKTRDKLYIPRPRVYSGASGFEKGYLSPYTKELRLRSLDGTALHGYALPGLVTSGDGLWAASGYDWTTFDDSRSTSTFALAPFIVREYAHQRDASLGEVRSDFTETVYWHPALVLPESGKATVEFQLSDDIAHYQVLVAGHTLDGRIGAITHTIEARKPFSVDPKLPVEISHTDTIDVPLRVTNDSDIRRTVSLKTIPSGFKSADKLEDMLELGPNGKSRKLLRLNTTRFDGYAAILLEGTSGKEKDTIARTIRVVPDGFPRVDSISDMLEKGRGVGRVALPKDVIPGSLRVRLEMYPTSMADLVKGLDGLLQEPYGCFEQTSTTNYPNTLILSYLNETNQAKPQVTKRAKDLLDKGYGRLTSFECPDTPTKTKQGYEWFGAADRPHLALTAYGLLQFKDMSRVHPVDPTMVQRTQNFLLSRRDGQGGFNQDSHSLHSWNGAKHLVNAYVVWALVESDPDDTERLDLKKEIAALKSMALDDKSEGGKDPYFVALVANVMNLRNDRQAANTLLDRLKEKYFKNGAVTGAQTSITRSGGRDLEIETTALALLGWLRANDPSYAVTIKDATKWISQQRGGYGGFGSTQSTIMALKALTLHAKKSAHPPEAGELRLSVKGKVIASRKFTEQDLEVIGLDIEKPEEIFKPGEAVEVEVTTDAKHAYPFALAYTYHSLTPTSADKCAVKISTKLAKTEATEGEMVPLSVTLENKLKQGHGMATAIIGIPAGMKVPTDMKQLTDLRERGQIAFFEIRGRELVLYWRELAPEQKIALTVDLVCDVPGVYRGPASRGYLYYDADHKHWVEPLSIKIAAMKE